MGRGCVHIDLAKAILAEEKNKQRKQTKMITIRKTSTSLISAINISVEYKEIVRTTFVGAFTDLSTALHQLGADWDYTRVDNDDSTMYDIYGTFEGCEFRIYVTCFFPLE